MGCAQSTPVKNQTAKAVDEGLQTANVKLEPPKNAEPGDYTAGQAAKQAADHSSNNGELAGCRIAGDHQEYKGSDLPQNEVGRKKHLDCLKILDTEPEKRFDDITRLCCMIFQVPIALVSLVDTERQWFKSVQGLQCNQTDRKSSFCAWTLLPANPEALVVENALEDARFKQNPLVTGPPNIRFYAGAPLVCSDGQRLGSLCIIDSVPRTFDAKSCSVLANMAEMVVREIEREKVLTMQLAANNSKDHEALIRAIDSYSDALLLVSPTPQSWTILYCNEACEQLLETPDLAEKKLEFWDIFDAPEESSQMSNTSSSIPGIAQQYDQAIENQRNFEMHLKFHKPEEGPAQICVVQFRCANNTIEDQGIVPIGIPNFLGTNHSGPTLYFAVVKDCKPVPGSKEPAKYIPTFSLTPSSQPFDDIVLGPLVGKGAFGRVYRGTWHHKQVAVKIIEYKESESKMALEGLLSENLSHPNVVQTFSHMTRPSSMNGYALEEQEDSMNIVETWLVLEFCNHGCISDAVQKGLFRTTTGTMEPDIPVILATATEIAKALAYLHSKRMLHIDLTGNNVLLTKAGNEPRGWMAKVSDFGLSRVVQGDDAIQTRTHGTVTHMPPELLMQGTMSKAVDVYSFGVICWEMLMGHRPFGGMSQSQVLHAVTCGKRLEVPANVPAPADFKRLVNECLARQPEKRPAFDSIVKQLEAMQARPQQQEQRQQLTT